MSELDSLMAKINIFRDERDWRQFHTPKDVAMSLVLEAAEVMEHFQWKKPEEIEKYLAEHKDEVGEELADVLFLLLIMAHDLDIDITEAMEKKLKKNSVNYPVDKAKGSALKYTNYK